MTAIDGSSAAGDDPRHVVGQLTDVLSGRGGTRSADEQACSAGAMDRADALAELTNRCDQRAGAGSFLESRWAAPGPVPGETVGSAIGILWHDDVERSPDARTVTVRMATGRIGHASTPRFLLAATGRASLLFDAHDSGLDIYSPLTSGPNTTKGSS